MSKATADLLELIHAKIAEQMLRKLESGEAEARDWAVIVKFLKDNHIDAVIGEDADNENAFARMVALAQESIKRQA